MSSNQSLLLEAVGVGYFVPVSEMTKTGRLAPTPTEGRGHPWRI